MMYKEKQKNNNVVRDRIGEDIKDNKKQKKRITRILIPVPKKTPKTTSAKSNVTKINKEKRKYDNADVMEFFEKEIDKMHYKEDIDVHGFVCAVCKIKSGEKVDKGFTVRSVKYPVYVFCGRTLYDCLHLLCNTCYIEESSKHNDKQNRPRMH